MRYYLSDETVTVTPPSGLYIVVQDIDGTGTIEIQNSVGTTLTSNPLPQKYPFPIDIIATGQVEVLVSYAGDNYSEKTFESNDSTGHYPGKWGSGVGAK